MLISGASSFRLWMARSGILRLQWPALACKGVYERPGEGRRDSAFGEHGQTITLKLLYRNFRQVNSRLLSNEQAGLRCPACVGTEVTRGYAVPDSAARSS